MDHSPQHFIGEEIEVQFDRPPVLEKVPGCPDRFIWKQQAYHVAEMIAEWQDHGRRGRMAQNMRLEHAAAAEGRGSWGVGRSYFRVRTSSGQVFDLYYDKAPKSADQRKGSWFLLRELRAASG